MIYKDEYLSEISFPLGGIGSGCIGLAGNGRLIDWEIFNRPNKGSHNGESHIAVKLIKNNKSYVKVLNSDLNKCYMGQYKKATYSGYGFGPEISNMCGFPHFKECEFNGEFPIADLKFIDDNFPGVVTLKAFNPFIPLDSKNSSIPAAFFEIIYKNETKENVEFQCVFSLANPFESSVNTEIKNENIVSVKLLNANNKDDLTYGDISLTCDSPTHVQPYWSRGMWQDGLSTFWNEFAYSKKLTYRTYNEPGKRDTCSMLKTVKLNPGETANIRYIVSWNIPNCNKYWHNNEDDGIKNIKWKNYYATQFADSVESGIYSVQNWDKLYSETEKFKNELFSSTVDDVIKDAVSSTISVLKSPTVMRLENGEFYGFEGCHEQSGSCDGTCQHVYNYAYALCFLFPDLERSIRNLEFKYATDTTGATYFRLQLPPGSEHGALSCVDGQMGCVFKTYREWKISGNNEWLKEVWPTVQKIMDYTWSDENPQKWDRNKDGVLEGMQHHTLDVELFGPSSWLEGFYLLALKAACEMAKFLGYNEKADEYNTIFENGQNWTKNNLFNGEYFIQKVDITNKKILEEFNQTEKYWNEETGEIKYQIGNGCSIDQLTGQWHSNILGLGDIFDKSQVKIALKNMFMNNFKSMRNITNMWRVFAFNDEKGSIMCDYPVNVSKPRIPITYCEECMTGFEYQFAGMLYSEGFCQEALEVIKAIRNRYDGKKRNPWNEIECGSNYVRAMSSFALLPIISGFKFDLPHYKIGFNPVLSKDNFKCIWSLGTGWGNIEINNKKIRINIKAGNLTLSEIDLPFVNKAENLIVDDKELTFSFKNGNLIFDKITIKDYLEIAL